MKILFINASPRQQSYTRKIMEEIKKGAEIHSPISEWIDTHSLQITPCRGCLQCRPDKECVLPPDDAHQVGRKIKQAASIIVGSPTYFGNMAGQLKILFDRLVTTFEIVPADQVAIPRPLLKGKKALIVTSSHAPWPVNQLPSQSRGCVKSIQLILKSGGLSIAGIINYADATRKGKLTARVIDKARHLGKKISR